MVLFFSLVFSVAPPPGNFSAYALACIPKNFRSPTARDIIALYLTGLQIKASWLARGERQRVVLLQWCLIVSYNQLTTNCTFM